MKHRFFIIFCVAVMFALVAAVADVAEVSAETVPYYTTFDILDHEQPEDLFSFSSMASDEIPEGTPHAWFTGVELTDQGRLDGYALNFLPQGSPSSISASVISGLQSPSYIVGGLETVTLSFWRYSTSNPKPASLSSCDSRLKLYVSMDSGPWYYVGKACGEYWGENRGWRMESFDLNVYFVDRLRFALVFELEDNAFITSGAAYLIDDVRLSSPESECLYAVKPTSDSRSSDMGSGVMTVITDPACSWTVQHTGVWLMVEPLEGRGEERLEYIFLENLAVNPRQGIIRIFGENREEVGRLTLRQDGYEPPPEPGMLPMAISFDDLSAFVPEVITPFVSEGEVYDVWLTKHARFEDWRFNQRGRIDVASLDMTPKGFPETLGRRVVGSARLGQEIYTMGREAVRLSLHTLYDQDPPPQYVSNNTAEMRVYYRTDDEPMQQAETFSLSDLPNGWKETDMVFPVRGAETFELFFEVVLNAVPEDDPNAAILLDDLELTYHDTGCDFDLSPISASVDALGGSVRFFLSATADCDWEIISDVSEVTAEPASGSGSKQIKLQVPENKSILARTIHARIQDGIGNTAATFTIVQDGAEYGDERELTGWWYTPGRTGTGLSLEVQGNHLFMVWYVYSAQGRPAWYASSLLQDEEGVWTGTLLEMTGPGLREEWYAPTSKRMGEVSLSFADRNKGRLKWYIDTVFSTPGEVEVKKYMRSIYQGTSDPRLKNGWWVDADYPGMGFFLETRGKTLFLGWYCYTYDGSPEWRTFGGHKDPGGFLPDTEKYTASLQEYINGPVLGGPYKDPVLLEPTHNGTLRISEQGDAATLDFTASDLIFHLQPYNFSGIILE